MTTLNTIRRKDGESDAEFLKRRGWTYNMGELGWTKDGFRKTLHMKDALEIQALSDQPILLAEIERLTNLLNLWTDMRDKKQVSFDDLRNELTERDELIRELLDGITRYENDESWFGEDFFEDWERRARALLATTNERNDENVSALD